MYRALVEPGADGIVELPEEELHHLVRVRRLQPGQSFWGVDGLGKEFRCRLEREGGRWWGSIQEVRIQRQPPLKIILAQSLVKKDRFEWILEKATELGVWEVVPTIAWRTEVKLGGSREGRMMARWNRIMLSAIKQSGQSRLPLLGRPVGLNELLARRTNFPIAIRLDEAGGSHLRDLMAQHESVGEALVLVGPEGGWDDRDREILDRHGVSPAYLGPRILRTETAAIAAISILQFQLGDLCDDAYSVYS